MNTTSARGKETPATAQLTAEEAAELATLMNDDADELSFSDRLYRFYRRQVNRAWKLALCGEGFSLKGARFWIRRCRADWNQRTYPKSKIRWAHHHGFTAAQVDRFGITEQNVDEYISERSFDYLQPINGKYNKWFTDRVTTRVVAGRKFRGLFETVHFNVISRFGELLFIPLSDEAQRLTDELGSARDAFFALIDAHGEDAAPLWLSGSTWRTTIGGAIAPAPHAAGNSKKRRYCLQGSTVSRSVVLAYLHGKAEKTPFVLYEAAVCAEPLSVFGDDASAAIRVILYNASGDEPGIGGVYVCIENLAIKDLEETAEDERPAIEGEDELYGDEGSPLVYRLCSLPIDLATGTYDGGRALLVGGSFEDASLVFAPELLRGTIPQWDAIKQQLIALMKHVPQIELLEVSVCPTADGFCITGVNPSPIYNRAYPFSPELQSFLKKKVEDKRENKGSSAKLVNKAAFRRSRRAFTKTLYPAGMVFYQGLRYPHDVIEDLFCRNGISLKRKLWGYRHGFLSYRMDLYPELGEGNWQQYMTDFEYRWLRHINPKYRIWMEDKLTIKYLLADFNEFLPAYYFFTSCRAGENRVIPLMDAPEGIEASIEGIIELARQKGILALKPDEGSHGEGFYKLTYSPEEGFALNGEAATEERVASIMRDPNNQYLVSEYIELHPDLKRIYPGSVNTVRTTVFKRDGVHPQVGNAYFRIGSARSGAVDNVVAGGFVAEVDVETGHFGDARTLVDNRLVHEGVHPDTNVPMEGELPHWDFVKDAVLRMAAAVPQLEYMGFDVAITQDGLKLLEVNRYPDYPRISRLTPATIGYLLERVAAKKRFVHIDRDKSLFKLPRRDA